FNDQVVTLVNNHFSSKGGSAPILGTEQPFEARQEDPTVNGSLDERQAQSQAVQGFVSDLLSTDPNAKVAVLGDFNEFEFVSPVQDLVTNSGLTNLTETLPADERYSFIFQGNSQSLDHILVSEALGDGADFDIVHVNSEFTETAQRASDHDPLLAQFTLAAAPNVINGTSGRDVLVGTDGNDIILGGLGRDAIATGGGRDQVVYTDIRDGIDIISDFMPGMDQIDISALLDSQNLNLTFDEAITQGYLQIGSNRGSAFAAFDPDGSAGNQGRAIPLFLAQNVDVAALNDAANFIL
ncbi:MAG: type I secretion C-terminal target domain-containing protein, partial [Leptolyngbyaceae cyanobacterium SM2_3_12]|nr:type I secretion C-terminal target domain-containing protein [Leptolyngbyaceae cyanobacterium SM2_3_12]